MSEEITNPTETPSPEGTPQPNPFADLLGEIKEGDRQKYSTVEDALKAITPAQQHIKTLEEENAALKEKVTQVASIEQLMAKLEEKATSQVNQPQGEQVFDESKLDALLDSRLTKREQDAIKKSNKDKVIAAFQDKYGDKAAEAYNKLATESGVGGDFLAEMAERSPQAVMQLAGLGGPKKPSQPSSLESQFNSEALRSNQDKPSAKVRMTGYTSDELLNAWKNTAPIEN